MIFKCPVCALESNDIAISLHMHHCGVLVTVDDKHECACGRIEPNEDLKSLLTHVCNTPHDWPKILVERELRSM